MGEFRSRGVRSLVELHERELREFVATWRRFVASGAAMPDAHGDSDYESAEKLVTHVQGAARGYLLWSCEMLGRPIAGLPRVVDPEGIVPRLDAFMDETLEAWRTHTQSLEDKEIAGTQYTSRWGEGFTIEQMLEHAVVHPMRHRIQLDRILAR